MRGHKLELMKIDFKVCLTFSIFNDFPNNKYKGHYHDYRSVIVKGIINIIDLHDNLERYQKGYNLLYTCNNREVVPLEN